MNRVFLFLGALAVAVLASSCATVQENKASKLANFRVVGYAPSWTGLLPADINYSEVTHLNYCFAIPKANGTLNDVPNPDLLSQFVEKAHASGVKVLVSIGGWMNDSPSPHAFIASGANPKIAGVFAQNALAMVKKYKLDGIDIDWEHPDEDVQANFVNLITALAATLHPEGKIVTAAVSVDNRNVLPAAVAALDFISIMAYDDNFGDGPSTGPHSSKDIATASLDFWLHDMAVPAAKLNLGVPFYGRGDASWSTALPYREILAKDPAAGTKDSSNGFNYNGIPTIQWKTKYAQAHAGGVMIWELGQDVLGNNPNSLLKAIYDAVDASPVPAK